MTFSYQILFYCYSFTYTFRLYRFSILAWCCRFPIIRRHFHRYLLLASCIRGGLELFPSLKIRCWRSEHVSESQLLWFHSFGSAHSHCLLITSFSYIAFFFTIWHFIRLQAFDFQVIWTGTIIHRFETTKLQQLSILCVELVV